MNSPEGEIGGLIDGSQESCERRVSFHVAPPSLERARRLLMKKFPGWSGASGASRRRSKNETLTCPLFVARTYGWNWSALVRSWLTRSGVLHHAPPSSEDVILMSACSPSSSDAGSGAGL